MELKDYCSNLSTELTGWKAKAYDIGRRLDKVSSGEKAKVIDQVRDLHILIEELENRIERLRRECPTEWSPDQNGDRAEASRCKNLLGEGVERDA